MPNEQSIKVFPGTSNPDLALKISELLDVPLGAMRSMRFSDGEMYVEVGENVRNSDVYIVQSTCTPANENLMELLITIDALKRASAKSICAVIPYYGYARQDRKVAPRTPITSKLVADLLCAAGASRSKGFLTGLSITSSPSQFCWVICEKNSKIAMKL